MVLGVVVVHALPVILSDQSRDVPVLDSDFWVVERVTVSRAEGAARTTREPEDPPTTREPGSALEAGAPSPMSQRQRSAFMDQADIRGPTRAVLLASASAVFGFPTMNPFRICGCAYTAPDPTLSLAV